MPISGLIITYSDSPAGIDAAKAVASESQIEMGERTGNRQAVVVETLSHDEDKALWAWLNGLKGVEFVDVAYIQFDDHPDNSKPATRTIPGETSA